VNWIEQLVTAFLKWCQGMAQADTRSEDAKSQAKLRDDLRRIIDRHESKRVREPGDSGSAR
jgi:hypothetical protein